MIRAETCTQAAAVHSRCEVQNVQTLCCTRLDMVWYRQKRVRRRLQYTAGVTLKVLRPCGAKGLAWYKRRNVYAGGCSTQVWYPNAQTFWDKRLDMLETCMQAAAVHRCGIQMPRPSGTKGLTWYDKGDKGRNVCTGGCSTQQVWYTNAQMQNKAEMGEMRTQVAAVHGQKRLPWWLYTEGAEMCTQAAAVHSRCEMQNAQTFWCKRPEGIKGAEMCTQAAPGHGVQKA
ncbi:hypothetical protein BaRGS_00037878 [Batillaria attramentaria]|uniref:Uncharacterized protein n=1 Tax=Batillaria attramentaria TaxID=370345 RepID=A0ABD0J7I8_9CAEN